MVFTISVSLLVLASGFAAFLMWQACIHSIKWDEEGVVFEGAVGLFFSLLALFSAFCVVYYNVGHYKTTVIDTQVVIEEGENGGEFEKLYVFVDKGDGYAKRYEFIGRNRYDAPQPDDKIDMTYREFYKRYEEPEDDNYYKISEISKEPS